MKNWLMTLPGDGNTDLLVRGIYSINPQILLSDGSTFLSSGFDPNLSYPKVDITTVLIFDIDGDRRDDLLFVKSPGFTELEYSLNKITGWVHRSFTLGTNQFSLYPPDPSKSGSNAFSIGGFFGDQSQIWYDPQYYDHENGNFSSPGILAIGILGLLDDNYVKSILDGYNQKTEFTFNSILDFRQNMDHPNYPNICVSGNTRVIGKLEQTGYFGNHVVKNTYNYENPRMNLEGLGFLGFDKITVHDDLSGFTQHDEYHFIDPNLSNQSGLFLNDKSYKYFDGIMIEYQETDFAVNVFKNTFLNGKWQFYSPQVVKLENRDLLRNTHTITNLSNYDNYGNARDVVEEFYDVPYNNPNNEPPIFIKNTTKTYSFANNGGWADWQPFQISITQTRHGEMPITITKDFEYYSNGKLKNSFIHKGTSGQVKVEYTYNSFGNLEDKVIRPINLPARTASYTWTPDKRFVATETNAMNWVKSYQYYPTLGRLEFEVDENGLQTEYKYDSFGRITKRTLPDGNEENTKRFWDVGETYAESLYFIRVLGTNQPPTQQWFNGKMQIIRKKHQNQLNEWVSVQSIYDVKGQLIKKSLPYFDGDPRTYVDFNYDNYGRKVSIISPNSHISKTYLNQTVTTTNITTGESKSKTIDATGKLSSMTDGGGTVTFDYNSWNEVKTIMSPSGTIDFSYDSYGRQESFSDPSSGITLYEYDALGQLHSQEDANGNTLEIDYDDLGRPTEKNGPDGAYTYAYDSQVKGKPDLITSPYGTSTTFNYDNLGRVTTKVESIMGQNFEFGFSYNAHGNLLVMDYPNGLSIEHLYSVQSGGKNYGLLYQIKNSSTNEIIWQYEDENVHGQITQYKLGETSVTRNYDLQSMMPIDHFNDAGYSFTYSFNGASGNMNYREDQSSGNHESFDYDDLNRLTQNYLIDPSFQVSVNYSNNGDIYSKSDVGTYENQLMGQTTSISDNPGTISNEAQSITYTPFHSVSSIMEGDYDAYFTYGPDDERRYMKITQSGNAFTERYYVGLYEKDFYNGAWRQLSFINTPTGIEAVYITDEGDNNHELKLLTLDNLGSIVQITEPNGTIIEEYTYDAWGNRRDPQTWQNVYYPGQNNYQFNGLIYRGYTGHEHLDCFGLVNMNGRVYDPLLGRMLSPDLFVPDPQFSQSYNRYAYVFNNPLKYTDPDGELPLWVGSALLGGIFNVSSNSANISGFGEALGYFGVGALAGYVGFASGNALASSAKYSGFFSGFGAGLIGGSATGYIGGTGNALMSGLNLAEASNQGLKSAVISGSITGLSVGIAQGIAAAKKDLNFWTGQKKAEVFYSPIGDIRARSKSEYCVQLCLEGVSYSYGYPELDHDFWSQRHVYGEWGIPSGKELVRFINQSTGSPFIAEGINPSVENIKTALLQDKRILVTFKYNLTPDSRGAHAVMIRKMKYWPSSGKFKLWYADPSQVPLTLPTTNTFITMPGNNNSAFGYYTISPWQELGPLFH